MFYKSYKNLRIYHLKLLDDRATFYNDKGDKTVGDGKIKSIWQVEGNVKEKPVLHDFLYATKALIKHVVKNSRLRSKLKEFDKKKTNDHYYYLFF